MCPVDSNGIAKLTCLPVILNNIINGAAVLAGVATVFFIVFGGIRFLTSGGDPTKVAKAQVLSLTPWLDWCYWLCLLLLLKSSLI